MIIEDERTILSRPEGRIDILVCAVGYESRSTWLAGHGELEPKKTLAYQFDYNQVLHYEKACAFYSSIHAELLPFPDEKGQARLRAVLYEARANHDGPIRIVIDISAMSRLMIATTLSTLITSGINALEVTAHYTPAIFQAPNETAPARVAEPIIPKLAGWSARPGMPLGVIIGLGYEGSAAAGALQVLEPNRAWTFYPVGPDTRYIGAVEAANEDLSTIYDVIKLTYDLMDPAGTRALMRRMLRELRADYRAALVPFGPKIFAWLCMLTAMEAGFEEVSVWRFSPQELGGAVDHEASGISVWHQFVIRAEATE